MKGIRTGAVLVNGEVEGFILNRLQGALLNEAWALYEEGHASLDGEHEMAKSYGLGISRCSPRRDATSGAADSTGGAGWFCSNATAFLPAVFAR